MVTSPPDLAPSYLSTLLPYYPQSFSLHSNFTTPSLFPLKFHAFAIASA